MAEYYVEECEYNKFVLNRPDGTHMTLTFEEMKAIESFMRHRRWLAEIINQMDFDAGNLDIDSDEDRDHFVNMCLDEIRSDIEIYGEDGYDPCIEKIVFDVAQDNGLWRY